MKKLPKATARRSSCPIATTLDLIGDKWSLLIIRDIGMFGLHRNKDFQDGNEGIPTNILASRLTHLVENGILEKRQYQPNPPRYEYHLTPHGEELVPIVKAMGRWGLTHVAGVKVPAK